MVAPLTKKKGHGCGRGHGKPANSSNERKQSHTLSEQHSQDYGITPPSSNTRTLCSGLQPMDYVSLNDGFYDEPTADSRKRKRITHRPRSMPSATRVAAQKHTTSPEAIEASNKDIKESDSTLSGITSSGVPPSGIPSASTSTTLTIMNMELTGVPPAENILPDLVRNCVPDTAETVNTGEELEIADALLSLGEVRDDTINEDDNAQLMPIGAPTGITDAAPVPILLD